MQNENTLTDHVRDFAYRIEYVSARHGGQWRTYAQTDDLDAAIGAHEDVSARWFTHTKVVENATGRLIAEMEV